MTLYRWFISSIVLFSGLVPRPGFSQEGADTAKLPETRGSLLLVVGAEGTPELGALFRDWASQWQTLAEKGHLDLIQLKQAEPPLSDHDQLRDLLRQQANASDRPLWLVLIGHGTFDGRNSKFNLRGEDVTTDELQSWLAPAKRPLAIIAACSSSGQLIEALSGPGRVIVSSTKNAAEVNFAHFGGYFTAAMGDPTSDLDKDEQVSLLEAFLRASRQTRDFYEADGRLETEHPLLDDNGDSLGTRSTAFRGITPIDDPQQAGTMPDGLLAHQWHLLPSTNEQNLTSEQRHQRDGLERQIARLRSRRSDFTEDAYYRELEILLVQLAEILVQKSP